ncbi:MAG: AAA family ATPase [Desulfovibrio sp.]
MADSNPILYIFSGLPGAGKSTLARLLSQRLGAVWLRIDTVEQALRDLCGLDVQGEGYRLAYRIARDNLLLGGSVVADCCNPIALTREEWMDVARNAGAAVRNIEICCSDPAEHRFRVENRRNSVPGLAPPSWTEVRARRYDPWESAERLKFVCGEDTEVLRIDTAGELPEQSFARLLARLQNVAGRSKGEDDQGEVLSSLNPR